MKNQRTRLTAIAGATMALVIAGSAAVSAAPGDRGRRDDDRGPGKARVGAQQGAKGMPGMQRLGGMRGMLDEFERRETTIQTADSTTTVRVEQGMVDSASDASLSFALGSGEAVTVGIDDDTRLVAYEEQTVERGRWSRERMVPTEIEMADIEAGAEIVVWSDSEDGGDFVASRIVLQPAEEADEDTDEDEATDEAESETEASVETTTDEDASATDA